MVRQGVRWRLEFIDYNGHHKLSYEAWITKMLACDASTLAMPRFYTMLKVDRYLKLL